MSDLVYTLSRGGNYVSNTKDHTVVFGTASDDYIENQGGNSVVIYGDAGNDILKVNDTDKFPSHNGLACTIYGGDGNDAIFSERYSVIYGEDGDDWLDLCPENTTVSGGTGKDVFHIAGYPCVSVLRDFNEIEDVIVFSHYGTKFEATTYEGGVKLKNYVFGKEKNDGWRMHTLMFEGQTLQKLKNAYVYMSYDVGYEQIAEPSVKVILSQEKFVKFESLIEGLNEISDDNYVSIYSTFSDNEKNQLLQSSFQELDKLLHIADNSDINLAKEDFQDSSLYQQAKNWTTLAKFIGKAIKHVTGGEFLDAFFTLLSSVDETCFYGKEFLDKSRDDISTFTIAESSAKALSKAITAVESIINFFDKTENLDEVANKFSFPFSVIASFTGLFSNIAGVLKDGGFNLNNTIELEKGSAKLINSIIKTASATSPKPLGPLAAGVALTTGVIAGVTQGIFSFKQYEHDKIPTALKNSLTDVVTTGIHEAASSFTLGADDAAFEVLTSFAE